MKISTPFHEIRCARRKNENWQQRIQLDPELHHGDPCIRGTRIPVSTILGSLADGMTPADVQNYYPQLSAEDIQAALALSKFDMLKKDRI